MLAGFLGYHLITRIPPLLHTPLMSATNAIAGISLRRVAGGGRRELRADQHGTRFPRRHLLRDQCRGRLPDDRPHAGDVQDPGEQKERQRPEGLILIGGVLVVMLVLTGAAYAMKPAGMGFGDFIHRHLSEQALRFCYIISAALFVLGLKALGSPRWARRGMWMAELGMFLAVVGTLFNPAIVIFQWIILGFVLGVIFGCAMGLWMPMTAVPERTALSRALGTLAACLIGVSEYLRSSGHLDRVTPHCSGRRGHRRRPGVHRQLDGGGQTAGPAAGPPADLPGAELLQPRAAGGHVRLRHLSDRCPDGQPAVLRDGGVGAAVWADARHPDRRRGHAGGARACSTPTAGWPTP